MKLKIRYLSSYLLTWGKMTYAKDGDSGMDLRAAIQNQIVILPGERAIIPNGIQCEIEAETNHYEIQIRPRSGLAAQKGISVLNTPGTVDWGYRGEIMTILLNTGNENFIVNPGDRISQMVICPIVRPVIEEVSELSVSQRGSFGFGSSGTQEFKS